MRGAPIRFLILMLGGWVAMRVVVIGGDFLSTDRDTETAPTIAVVEIPTDREAARRSPDTSPEGEELAALGAPPEVAGQPALGAFRPPFAARSPIAPDATRRVVGAEMIPSFPPLARAAPVQAGSAAPVRVALVAPSLAQGSFTPRLSPRRWSGSAWLLARGEGGAALAPGGTLGGSQAGARLLYRLNRDPTRALSLSARLYSPLRRSAGAEAAIGLDWRPVAALPVHLLVERRQRLGREGRSAFSIAAYGGASADLGRGVRLDAYGQAGVVGLRARDAFIDGSARVSARLGPVEAGGAVWAAAQPGVGRLDIGPHLTIPLRTGGTSLRMSAEWRFRVAGEARPRSGPALTLGADF